MSKAPWEDEPTPMTDAVCGTHSCISIPSREVALTFHACTLEQRLRHAERLLEEHPVTGDKFDYRVKWYNRYLTHFDHAKEMDDHG